MTDPTVIVAGGGPVGLATAYGLATAGVDVTVLDKNDSVLTAPRAMAYLFFVHDGFERLGILDDLHAEAVVGDGINFIDWESGEEFHSALDAVGDDVAHPYTLHLGQDQISRILLRRLQALPNVEVRYGLEVSGVAQDDDGVTVTTIGPEGETQLRSAWLIGADGANSSVRKLVGLGFDGMTWPDRFISTNVTADLESAGLRIANWRIDPVYGAILAKINADDLWRFTFPESGDLSDEGLEDRIHEHFAVGMPGHVDYELVQFQPYRMHQRAAKTFRLGRVLLAGDAAHITNPVGGLGLTGGFLDSFVLSEALAAVIHGSIGDEVLDEYSDKRRDVFLHIASPAATANKKMLFDPHPAEAKQQLLAGLRHMSQDRVARRKDLLQMLGLITPSLLNGKGIS
jgi:3-(3-hydroxy-phenyl)propionate hydroxylase